MATIENTVEKFCKENVPAFQFMDIKIESASNGIYRCLLPFSSQVSNHFNSVYAGFQWSLAEVLGGILWYSSSPDERFIPIVRSMTIDFKKPAFTDLVAEARFSEKELESMKAALLTEGRYNFDLKAIVKNTDGEIVAESLGRYAVRAIN